MKLVNFVCSILCIFTFSYNTNAMSFSDSDKPINFQYTGMTNNPAALCKDIQQFKKEMNSRMINFHRGIQSFESDIFMQAVTLRHHFWQLEMIVDDQLSKHLDTGGKEWGELRWQRWTIRSESEEPLFGLRLNIQRMKDVVHRQINELTQGVRQISKKNNICKNRIQGKRTFKLNQEVEQFNLAVDEHLFGLHNDVKRLESVVEEQIFEFRQDVDFLKSKIDLVWSKLQQSLMSICVSIPDFQQAMNTELYTSWQDLLQYVQCLDMVSSKNMFRTRQEISLLRMVIYEDISSLHQNARSLQTDICGEFSYKYNRFLRCR